MKVIKVICINSKLLSLTTGKKYKTYEADYFNNDRIKIVNDRGILVKYLKENFITLEEYRNQKLEELGI